MNQRFEVEVPEHLDVCRLLGCMMGAGVVPVAIVHDSLIFEVPEGSLHLRVARFLVDLLTAEEPRVLRSNGDVAPVPTPQPLDPPPENPADFLPGEPPPPKGTP